MGEGHVLVVDDDTAVGQVLATMLRQAGFAADYVTSGSEALRWVAQRGTDVVVTDLRMPAMDGMALLRTLRTRHPDLPVAMLTAHGTVERAVEAMKEGATDFLLKPFDREQVLWCVRRAMAEAEHAAGRPAAAPVGRTMIGDSEGMRELGSLLDRVARSDATVLLTGETGTGKEVAARAMHDRSARAAEPFVAVQCAALPETLLESELFGHEKGAFTGATARKPGRVELAEGGTLLLDEIGEVPPAIQAKLLRLLQEREYHPVGATAPRRADVRFVAATHRNLEAMVHEGSFREDLYYRLAVVPVHLPPLRERHGDVPLLVRFFWRRACEAHGRQDLTLSDAAVRALERSEWPGNVRELQNFVERLVILGNGPTVDATEVERLRARSSTTPAPDPPAAAERLEDRVRSTERDALLSALDKASNNRTVAARLLGVSRRTLYNKLAEHGLV